MTRALYNMNLLTKLIVLILFNLAIAAITEAILIRTSTEQVPSLHRVARRYLKLVTSANFWTFMPIIICTNVVCSVGHDLALFCADFHSICCCSVYESVGEVLKFTIAAAHKIDVVSDSLAAYGPSTNGDGCLVVMECFLHDLL